MVVVRKEWLSLLPGYSGMHFRTVRTGYRYGTGEVSNRVGSDRIGLIFYDGVVDWAGGDL